MEGMKFKSTVNFNIGFRLESFSGRDKTLVAKSIVILTDLELEYLTSVIESLSMDDDYNLFWNLNGELVKIAECLDMKLEKGTNADETAEEFLSKKYFTLKAEINKSNDVKFLEKVLEKAKELGKSDKVIGLLETRLSELS